MSLVQSEDDVFAEVDSPSVPVATRLAKRYMDLTDEIARALTPQAKEYLVMDRTVRHLAVRVRPSGHKAYYAIALGRRAGHGESGRKPVKRALGDVDGMSIHQARQAASDAWDRHCWREEAEWLSKSATVTTFCQALEQYLAGSESVHWDRKARLLKEHALPRFRDRPISSIRLSEYEDAIREALRSGSSHANDTHKGLKALLNWCVSRRYLDANPLARRPAPWPSRRTTYTLSLEHIARIYRASQRMEPPWRAMVGLIVLQAMTVEEVRQLRIDDIDWENTSYRSYRCRDAGNGCGDPLSEQALELLLPYRFSKGFLFASPRGLDQPIELRPSILERLQFFADLYSSHWGWRDLISSTGVQLRSLELELRVRGMSRQEPEWRRRRRDLLNRWNDVLLEAADTRTVSEDVVL